MYNLLKGDANEFDTEQAYNIFDLDENGTVTIEEFMIMLRADYMEKLFSIASNKVKINLPAREEKFHFLPL